MEYKEFLAKSFIKEQYIEEKYKHGFIKAWKEKWKEYNKEKDKWEDKSQIVCLLLRKDILNLGEGNDGSKFTSVNQAVNVAKGLCNYDEEKELESKLRNKGYKNEDFFKYNPLKDLERLEIKKRLLND